MANTFEIKGDWSKSESGQKYVAKAVTETGRILGIATVDVPIEVGVEIARYYGSEELKTTIEDTAKEQVRRLAEATPEE